MQCWSSWPHLGSRRTFGTPRSVATAQPAALRQPAVARCQLTHRTPPRPPPPPLGRTRTHRLSVQVLLSNKRQDLVLRHVRKDVLLQSALALSPPSPSRPHTEDLTSSSLVIASAGVAHVAAAGAGRGYTPPVHTRVLRRHCRHALRWYFPIAMRTSSSQNSKRVCAGPVRTKTQPIMQTNKQSISQSVSQ